MSDQLVEGETHPSGLADETECPSDHDNQNGSDNACYTCGAQT